MDEIIEYLELALRFMAQDDPRDYLAEIQIENALEIAKKLREGE